MLFVCGDTHGGEDGDLRKLGSKKFSSKIYKDVELKFSTKGNFLASVNFNVKPHKSDKNKDGKKLVDLHLNKSNNLVVLGDFGLVWTRPGGNKKHLKEELYYLKNLTRKSYQVCFLDGNHENHDMLNELSTIDYCGGKVGVAFQDSKGMVLHLKRGEVYTFNGKKVLVMGGAASYDTDNRTHGINWWSNEVMSNDEEQHTLDNLSKHNFKVDVVLTHNGPQSIGISLSREIVIPSSKPYDFMNREYNNALANKEKYTFKANDKNALFFQLLIDKYNLQFNEWHFGHFHQDKIVNKKFHLHYNKPPFKLF